MSDEDGYVFCGPVPASAAGARVDRAVALVSGCSRSRAAGLVDAGRVRVNGRLVRERTMVLHAGEQLEVEDRGTTGDIPAPNPAVCFTVVHEDPDIVIVDKPTGLVVHPGAGHLQGTLVNGLLARYPEIADLSHAALCAPSRPGIVHRLDRETSGLLAVARTPMAFELLVRQLSQRRVVRCYLALVEGHVADARGIVDAPVGRSARDPTRMSISASGRPARTGYRVVRRYGGPAACTLLDLSLETGRTHQIRVHLAALGHPVVADRTYGRGADRLERALGRGRLFLHAHRLCLAHPADGTFRSWESALPPDLRSNLDRLVE